MNNMYGNEYGVQPNYWYQGESDYRNVKSTCERLKNYHVIGQMRDGTQIEGIIEDMDDENVTMLVPETVEEDELPENRQYGPYGYGGYSPYGGYRRRFRRYRRRRFPYYSFIFPFFFPYPYYY